MTLTGRGAGREDLAYRARNVREAIDACRRIGDIAGVRDLNRTLTAICGEAERALAPAAETALDEPEISR